MHNTDLSACKNTEGQDDSKGTDRSVGITGVTDLCNTD